MSLENQGIEYRVRYQLIQYIVKVSNLQYLMVWIIHELFQPS